MIKRKIEKKIKELAKGFPIISIVGPRQSGKTTLAKHAFPNHEYVSLENSLNHERAMSDPIGFLEQYKSGVIIDEAQKAPILFSHLQEIVDTNKKMGAYILTGSQNFLLLESITQSLAGRAAILQLLPFSREEISDQWTDPLQYIWNGMYPPIYDRKVSPNDWLSTYIQTYLERDVRSIINIKDLSDFQKFIRICAGRVGQLINLSDIANDCGVSHNTIKSWLSILEASYIIFFLKPFHKNFNKRLTKQSKLYFVDTGLASALLEIETAKQLETHYAKGALFENFIISNTLKNRFNKGQRSNLYFWRDHRGKEIDLIFEEAGEIIAIEIKSTQTIKEHHLENLNYLNKISEDKIKNLMVIYSGNKSFKWKEIKINSWKEI